MIVLQMQGIQFEVDEVQDGQAVLLKFTDPQSGILVIIPFDPPSWENFARAVEHKGIPSIATAKAIPHMEIPGKR